MKRRKPEFVMQGTKNLKRLGNRWRKPRGAHSKLREHKTAKGFLPRPGYGSPRDVKYLHPSGFEEKLIYNSEGLTGIDAQKQACRIASSVGKKKRIDIMKKAEELKIRILNPLRIEAKALEKVDKK